MHKAFSMKHLTLIGMMGALASVLMLFRFPLPFMPPFLSFDLAGVPELIGGFVLRVGEKLKKIKSGEEAFYSGEDFDSAYNIRQQVDAGRGAAGTDVKLRHGSAGSHNLSKE